MLIGNGKAVINRELIGKHGTNSSTKRREIAEIKAEASHYRQPQAASIEAKNSAKIPWLGFWMKVLKRLRNYCQMSPAELDGVATLQPDLFGDRWASMC